MSNKWVPINPPIISIRNETEEKDSHLFPGTHMIFNVKKTYIEYAEFSTRGPLGVPVPPYPTGKTEWRGNGPSIRGDANIHMTKDAVDSMYDNEQSFADIMANFTSGAAYLFFQLGHATYALGLANAKNADGSLDIHLTALGATARGNPILLPPDTCAMILHTA